MSNPYRSFFIEHPKGKEFMQALDELIASKHRDAENDPDHARDHVQRAKGVREVTSLINSLSAEESKATAGM